MVFNNNIIASTSYSSFVIASKQWHQTCGVIDQNFSLIIFSSSRESNVVKVQVNTINC